MMKKKNNTIYTPIWSPQYKVTDKYQWTMFKQPTPIFNEKIEFRTFQIIQHFYLSQACPPWFMFSPLSPSTSAVKIIPPDHNKRGGALK